MDFFGYPSVEDFVVANRETFGSDYANQLLSMKKQVEDAFIRMFDGLDSEAIRHELVMYNKCDDKIHTGLPLINVELRCLKSAKVYSNCVMKAVLEFSSELVSEGYESLVAKPRKVRSYSNVIRSMAKKF